MLSASPSTVRLTPLLLQQCTPAFTTFPPCICDYKKSRTIFLCVTCPFTYLWWPLPRCSSTSNSDSPSSILRSHSLPPHAPEANLHLRPLDKPYFKTQSVAECGLRALNHALGDEYFPASNWIQRRSSSLMRPLPLQFKWVLSHTKL